MIRKTTRRPPDLPEIKTTSDIRGASRLLIDAVTGVTDIVESMHLNIARVSPLVGDSAAGKTGGVTGFVYRSVRGVTRAIGVGIDAALGQLAPLINSARPIPQRDAVLAALNGVLGDYLDATNNPLAIPMQFRQRGAPLAKDPLSSTDKLLVLVHGLCMNDLQWQRDGHDHGAALAGDLGHTPIYLYYNSGRHIATNGREFADRLEELLRARPFSELVIVGHSMGGLVARSACHYAQQSQHSWLPHLKAMIFLGSPHHGAPLERAGNWLDVLLDISPYTAPFGRLGYTRSAGIKDLRHGKISDGDAATMVALPTGVKCFAIAATKQIKPGKRRSSDGLVPVNSALGVHKDAALTLKIPASRQYVCYGVDHFALLSSDVVYERMRSWLAKRSR